MSRLIVLLMVLFQANTFAQQNILYYNFPENVKSKLNLRINEMAAASKNDKYASQLVIVVDSKGADTTLVWISKFLNDNSDLNAVINNSNRFFKHAVTKSQTEIPIIFESDLQWAEPLRKMINIERQTSFTKTFMAWDAWLVKFIYKNAVDTIVDDKLYYRHSK